MGNVLASREVAIGGKRTRNAMNDLQKIDQTLTSVDQIGNAKKILLAGLEAQRSIRVGVPPGTKQDNTVVSLCSSIELVIKILDIVSVSVTSACDNTSSMKEAKRAHLKSTKVKRRATKSRNALTKVSCDPLERLNSIMEDVTEQINHTTTFISTFRSQKTKENQAPSAAANSISPMPESSPQQPCE